MSSRDLRDSILLDYIRFEYPFRLEPRVYLRFIITSSMPCEKTETIN